MKKNLIYNLFILIIYTFIYIWYLSAVKEGGMKDLAVVVTIIYIVIPLLSIIGGIVQRILIKKLLIFILISYILNCLLSYLITDSLISGFILSLIYAGITVILSYATRSVIILWKRKK